MSKHFHKVHIASNNQPHWMARDSSCIGVFFRDTLCTALKGHRSAFAGSAKGERGTVVLTGLVRLSMASWGILVPTAEVGAYRH